MVRSGLPEPIGGRFGVIAKALLAFTKRHLGSLAVLDVGRRSVPFDNVARLIAQRLGAQQEPAILAIEAPEPCFEPASHTGFPYCAPLPQHAPHVVGMKSARPAGRSLVRCQAGIVE